VDATETPIERPKKTAQALFGQEEAAHRENAGRGEEIQRLIVCLTFASGKTHGFWLFKESLTRFLTSAKLLLDSGYQGKGKLHGNCDPPKKSPLSAEGKRGNRELSGARARNEHAIGLVKWFRILAERYRNRRRRFGLHFSLIAGICNFELAN